MHGDLETLTTILRSLPDARCTHAAERLRLPILADAVSDGDVQAQQDVFIPQARSDTGRVDADGRDAYDRTILHIAAARSPASLLPVLLAEIMDSCVPTSLSLSPPALAESNDKRAGGEMLAQTIGVAFECRNGERK